MADDQRQGAGWAAVRTDLARVAAGAPPSRAQRLEAVTRPRGMVVDPDASDGAIEPRR